MASQKRNLPDFTTENGGEKGKGAPNDPEGASAAMESDNTAGSEASFEQLRIEFLAIRVRRGEDLPESELRDGDIERLIQYCRGNFMLQEALRLEKQFGKKDGGK